MDTDFFKKYKENLIFQREIDKIIDNELMIQQICPKKKES